MRDLAALGLGLAVVAVTGCLPDHPLVTDLGEVAAPAGTGDPTGSGGGDAVPSGPSDGGAASSPDLALSPGALDPPRGAGSGGSGGAASAGVSTRMTSGGFTYRVIVPTSYNPATKVPLLIVYSGTEGGGQMAQNMAVLPQAVPSIGGYIRAVLDGVVYNGNAAAGAAVIDELRATYNIDNDRTYLLGESAGTTAAFKLGFHLRQRYFAAYWANDVAAAQADGPELAATQLGFRPWGQVGPGGAAALAAAVAQKITAAAYRTDSTTPYAGPGAGVHGDPNQLLAAITWFDGKTR